jgi:hypothetical protein
LLAGGVYTEEELHLRGGQHDDGSSALFQTGTNSCNGAGLRGVGGAGSQRAELVVQRSVGDGSLGQQASLMHDTNRLNGVVSLGGLSGQHDTVGSVKNGVSNIRNLSTGGAGVVSHRLKHLGSANDGLSSEVALGDHHLLGNEDLGGGDLNSEISTGNHDSVSELKNLVEVVDSLLVLDLGDNLDILSILSENLTDSGDVRSLTDERGKDHVDTVLDSEAQVGLVLLGERGKVDIGLGKVDSLAGRDLSVVQAASLDGLLVDNLLDLEGEDTVVNIDDTAGLDDLGDVLVVEVPAVWLVLAAGRGVLAAGRGGFGSG